MELTLGIAVLLVLSLLLNLRSWLGRGGARFPLPGGGSVYLSRREVTELFTREMTDEEYAAIVQAQRQGHNATAQTLMIAIVLRYLRHTGRASD